ncbi:hypothetical protein Pint_10010 [Pistacia integerrima]|uniref:Uncharacterized protein n=1 Tax=Pistacia integerrima TaxID=434235 RepID=A0ACC0XG38_9ROSI|nr:hypothetical protein Pint_10010 [Pistacia integerrima]
MEGYRKSMTFTIYIMVLLAFATFGANAQDVGAVAPTPMESSGVALSVPALLAAIVSLLAWFF